MELERLGEVSSELDTNSSPSFITASKAAPQKSLTTTLIVDSFQPSVSRNAYDSSQQYEPFMHQRISNDGQQNCNDAI